MPFAGFPGQFVIVNISFGVINMFSTRDSIFSLRFRLRHGKNPGAGRPHDAEDTTVFYR